VLKSKVWGFCGKGFAEVREEMGKARTKESRVHAAGNREKAQLFWHTEKSIIN
jgi:hypothetical protein